MLMKESVMEKKNAPWRRPCEAQCFCPTEGVLRARLAIFYSTSLAS